MDLQQEGARCNNLIEATAGALNGDIITLMLLAVQKNNLGLSVNLALKWSVHQFKGTIGRNLIKLCRVYPSGRFDTKTIVRECLFPFPFLWASVHLVFIVSHAHEDKFCLIHSWCVLASHIAERLT